MFYFLVACLSVVVATCTAKSSKIEVLCALINYQNTSSFGVNVELARFKFDQREYARYLDNFAKNCAFLSLEEFKNLESCFRYFICPFYVIIDYETKQPLPLVLENFNLLKNSELVSLYSLISKSENREFKLPLSEFISQNYLEIRQQNFLTYNLYENLYKNSTIAAQEQQLKNQFINDLLELDTQEFLAQDVKKDLENISTQMALKSFPLWESKETPETFSSILLKNSDLETVITPNQESPLTDVDRLSKPLPCNMSQTHNDEAKVLLDKTSLEEKSQAIYPVEANKNSVSHNKNQSRSNLTYNKGFYNREFLTSRKNYRPYNEARHYYNKKYENNYNNEYLPKKHKSYGVINRNTSKNYVEKTYYKNSKNYKPYYNEPETFTAKNEALPSVRQDKKNYHSNKPSVAQDQKLCKLVSNDNLKEQANRNEPFKKDIMYEVLQAKDEVQKFDDNLTDSVTETVSNNEKEDMALETKLDEFKKETIDTSIPIKGGNYENDLDILQDEIKESDESLKELNNDQDELKNELDLNKEKDIDQDELKNELDLNKEKDIGKDELKNGLALDKEIDNGGMLSDICDIHSLSNEKDLETEDAESFGEQVLNESNNLSKLNTNSDNLANNKIGKRKSPQKNKKKKKGKKSKTTNFNQQNSNIKQERSKNKIKPDFHSDSSEDSTSKQNDLVEQDINLKKSRFTSRKINLSDAEVDESRDNKEQEAKSNAHNKQFVSTLLQQFLKLDNVLQSSYCDSQLSNLDEKNENKSTSKLSIKELNQMILKEAENFSYKDFFYIFASKKPTAIFSVIDLTALYKNSSIAKFIGLKNLVACLNNSSSSLKWITKPLFKNIIKIIKVRLGSITNDDLNVESELTSMFFEVIGAMLEQTFSGTSNLISLSYSRTINSFAQYSLAEVLKKYFLKRLINRSHVQKNTLKNFLFNSNNEVLEIIYLTSVVSALNSFVLDIQTSELDETGFGLLDLNNLSELDFFAKINFNYDDFHKDCLEKAYFVKLLDKKNSKMCNSCKDAMSNEIKNRILKSIGLSLNVISDYILDKKNALYSDEVLEIFSTSHKKTITDVFKKGSSCFNQNQCDACKTKQRYASYAIQCKDFTLDDICMCMEMNVLKKIKSKSKDEQEMYLLKLKLDMFIDAFIAQNFYCIHFNSVFGIIKELMAFYNVYCEYFYRLDDTIASASILKILGGFVKKIIVFFKSPTITKKLIVADEFVNLPYLKQVEIFLDHEMENIFDSIFKNDHKFRVNKEINDKLYKLTLETYKTIKNKCL